MGVWPRTYRHHVGLTCDTGGLAHVCNGHPSAAPAGRAHTRDTCTDSHVSHVVRNYSDSSEFGGR
jgi:hypothetical protein